MSIAVVAEKPSVARDIARVLGAGKTGDGFLHGNGYVVTWAIGHLASLAAPHEINPEWKAWRQDRLPMLPREWPLVVYEKTSDQFEVVRRILTSPQIASVVCATDAGREGELIFRYIYEAARSNKPVERLWISSLTPDAIRKGFENLRPSAAYDALADAARGRSRADWLVGMNLSRSYSLAFGETSPSAVFRRPPSPCSSNANWPSVPLWRKTTSKWSRPSSRSACPWLPLQGHMVSFRRR
jgi:DNA topoisomerase III